MNALFLADAHLRDPDSPSQAKVLHFLNGLTGPRGHGYGAGQGTELQHIGLLVLAGDFFDFWFARGQRVYPGFRPVLDRLSTLKAEGVRIVLCEGNHDFHLNDYFVRHLGFEVYEDSVDLTLDGKRVMVAHGDTVDRGNRKYLALRRFLRSAFALKIQQVLPLSLLWGMARYSSSLSKGMSRESQDRVAAIMERYAKGQFEMGYDAVILGHCHKPGLLQVPGKGSVKTFVTLGDWLSHDSYLLYQDGHFLLHHR